MKQYWYNTLTGEMRYVRMQPAGFGWIPRCEVTHHHPTAYTDEDDLADVFAVGAAIVGMGIAVAGVLGASEDGDFGGSGGDFGGGGASGDW